jgi:hypothetical protein
MVYSSIQPAYALNAGNLPGGDGSGTAHRPQLFLTRAACSSVDPLAGSRHPNGSLASETWQDLLDAHPAVANCIGSATLAAAWELDNRAEYQPDSAMIVIRVPGTAPNLRSQMVHEFAHHIEFTCPEQGELRSAFTHAQGFSGSTEWFDGETWETTPSEQYAEATVELVLGRRPHHGNIQISAQAADIVRRWASDS